jgi:hypothetical protein
MVKILGREPALWLALVAVGVKLATAFGLDVSTDQQAVINAAAAAVVGLVVAVMVHDGLSAAILGLVQAAVALAVGFGLDWSADRQAVVMSAAAAVVGMFVRTQVTAKVTRDAVGLAA